MVAVTPLLVTEELLRVVPTTTIRNTNGGWHLIHAPTSTEYADGLAQITRHGGLYDSGQLCSLQLRMTGRFTCIEVTWCIRNGGYYYLRNTSNLGPSHPAGYGQYPDVETAMQAAMDWCQQAPAYREAAIRTDELYDGWAKMGMEMVA